MKKIFTMTLAALAAMTLAACGGGQTDATQTAQKFFDAWYGGDITKAIPMIVPDDRPNINTAEAKEFLIRMDEQYKKREYTGVVASDSRETYINETEARIAFDVTSGADPEFDERISIKLELVDGKWFVSDWDMYNL